ncbi:MAG: hypothetical protein FD174_509 [Geobacteraceae bacterium]|nr:MAG: hypothetical protein FD174_509 [Geobacteraceae bacterium]
MRVFSIQSDGKFHEYMQTPFQIHHEEAILEDWLESNPDGIVEDGKILVIGRQVATDLGGFIDLLGVDREGDVVVVELKRDRTPRDTLAQALEYASFAERLDTGQLESILRSYLNDESLSLAEHHREYFELGSDEAVAFNKDQRIVIVGQRVTQEIRQTASFLRSKGFRVTCVEFTFFQANGGTRLLSQEIVVGKESGKPRQVASGSLPIVTANEFLGSLDDNGKAVFSRILQLAKEKSMPIHWGTKGFSLNVDLGGRHVAICFGYPAESVYKQSIYTALRGRGGMASKTAVPEDVFSSLWSKAEATGLFVPAGRELKCLINRKLSEEEISSFLDWCEAVTEAVREHGLKE